MAGSRKDFLYTDDSGSVYAINLDESNTEAVNGNAGTITTANNPRIFVPRNVKPRELFYGNAARTRRIRCVALTPTIYGALLTPPFPPIPDPIDATAPQLQLQSANGERRRIPSPIDTGLLDGDQP